MVRLDSYAQEDMNPWTQDIFIGGGGEDYGDAAGPVSEICQPARADRRRHRHRQDGDAADPGRRVFERRACRCSCPM